MDRGRHCKPIKVGNICARRRLESVAFEKGQSTTAAASANTLAFVRAFQTVLQRAPVLKRVITRERLLLCFAEDL